MWNLLMACDCSSKQTRHEYDIFLPFQHSTHTKNPLVYIIYLKFHALIEKRERLSGKIEFSELKGRVGVFPKKKHISSLSNPIYLLTSKMKWRLCKSLTHFSRPSSPLFFYVDIKISVLYCHSIQLIQAPLCSLSLYESRRRFASDVT